MEFRPLKAGQPGRTLCDLMGDLYCLEAAARVLHGYVASVTDCAGPSEWPSSLGTDLVYGLHQLHMELGDLANELANSPHAGFELAKPRAAA